MYPNQTGNYYYIQGLSYPEDTEVGLNIFLYLGLGLVAIGLVLTVVGVGEKGFRTLEMKLLGPALLVVGIVFALLRRGTAKTFRL